MVSSTTCALERDRRRLRRVAIASALALPVAVALPNVFAPSAAGAVLCAFNAASLTVTITLGADDAATIARSGSSILVDGSACGSATVNNTDTVSISGSSAGNETVTVDLSGGPFEPGATVEGVGTSEIEFLVSLGSGTDSLIILGGSSAETMDVSDTGVDANGDGDIDLVPSGVEAIVVDGGGGDDTISSSATSGISMRGGSGNDTLLGGPGNDTIEGQDGNDILSGGVGDDAFVGGPGIDTVDFSSATGKVDASLLVGTASGEGNDTLSGIEEVLGSPFGGALTGDQNDNIFVAAGGNDVIDGSGGSDTVDYAGSSGPVTVDLSLSIPQTTGGSALDTLLNIENVDGGSFDDILGGNSASNRIDGRGGSDTVSYANGGGGVDVNLPTDSATGAGTDALVSIENAIGSGFDDTIAGDAQNNVLNGGGGIDTLDYSSAGSASPIARPTNPSGTPGVTISLAVTGPQNTGIAGTDTVTGFEDVTGSGHDDRITGDAGANLIAGGGGDDTLDGGAGQDLVSYQDAINGIIADLGGHVVTGDGTDTLSNVEGVIGSAFNDTFIGSNGDDLIDGAGGSDLVSYAGSALAIIADLLGGSASGQGADTLISVERMIGTPKADTLLGGPGPNTIRGGGGDDRIVGRAGADRMLGGSGEDNIKGSGSDDRLVGGTGDDHLSGGGGKDTILGRQGRDTCIGGPAADTFSSCETQRG